VCFVSAQYRDVAYVLSGLTVVKARHCGHVKNVAESLLALAVVTQPGAILACAPGSAVS
jgi:hypothetical protein